MTTGGMTPLPEFLRQGAMGPPLLILLEFHEALMHQIEGVVDQLGGLFGGHGNGSEWCGCRQHQPAEL